MLDTETWTLETAIEELDERIDEYEDALDKAEASDDIDDDSDEVEMLQTRVGKLRHRRNGLVWQRDEEDWGADAVIKLGAPTAGEEALMHRNAPDTAGEKEMRLWYIATGTAEAPYWSDDLDETFGALSDVHPGYIKWAEAQINGLGVSGNGMRSSTSSTGTEDSATSTDKPDSTTSSSSASPTE